jgi:hypothetical protein
MSAADLPGDGSSDVTNNVKLRETERSGRDGRKREKDPNDHPPRTS